MPAKSQAQFRLMQAAAHNPEVAKRVGIKPSVASEFVSGQKNYKKLPEKKDKFKKLRKSVKM